MSDPITLSFVKNCAVIIDDRNDMWIVVSIGSGRVYYRDAAEQGVSDEEVLSDLETNDHEWLFADGTLSIELLTLLHETVTRRGITYDQMAMIGDDYCEYETLNLCHYCFVLTGEEITYLLLPDGETVQSGCFSFEMSDEPTAQEFIAWAISFIHYPSH